jgi:hypothetical protein
MVLTQNDWIVCRCFYNSVMTLRLMSSFMTASTNQSSSNAFPLSLMFMKKWIVDFESSNPIPQHVHKVLNVYMQILEQLRLFKYCIC